MKLVNKKRIIYNSSEYFITIKKKYVGDYISYPYYFIYIFKRRTGLLKHIIIYKNIFKKRVAVDNFNKNIDEVIDYGFRQLKENLKETKYLNSEKYIIDAEYKEQLYEEFYNKVINDLKEQKIIDKDIEIAIEFKVELKDLIEKYKNKF